MKPLSLRGRLVVVTGASAGLGRAIALELAAREGADLVIAARRIERLRELEREIGAVSTSRVVTVRADIGTAEGRALLFDSAIAAGPVFGIVNNAGSTLYGATLEHGDAEVSSLIAVDFLSVVDLSRRFLAYFLGKGRGAILNVTSQAAFIPVPYQNVYSAAKHAAQCFTENLAQEYRRSGVVISTFAPGGIDTELIRNAGVDGIVSTRGVFFLSPQKAARLAVRAMKRGRYRGIPGPLARTMVIVSRLLPALLVGRIAARVFRPR